MPGVGPPLVIGQVARIEGVLKVTDEFNPQGEAGEIPRRDFLRV
jgi:hypothetical protein